MRTLGRRIQGRAPNKAFLEAGAGLGFKKILRRSLRVRSANKSNVYKPKQNLFGGRGRSGIKKLLDATCAYTRPTIPRFTAPNKAFLEAGAGLGAKRLLRHSLCIDSANNSKVYGPKQSLLEAGAGLGPQRFLDAAWAYTRPTNISRPQTNTVWTPGPAWALKGS